MHAAKAFLWQQFDRTWYISVWFTVPAHPTSDSPCPASHVAAVTLQCWIAFVITQEGQPSLSSGLATLFVFHSKRGAQRQPEASLTSSVQSEVFFPFFFLSSMLPPSKVWQASQRYQERDRDRNSARDIQSLQHQSACLPACLPACLTLSVGKFTLLY